MGVYERLILVGGSVGHVPIIIGVHSSAHFNHPAALCFGLGRLDSPDQASFEHRDREAYG